MGLGCITGIAATTQDRDGMWLVLAEPLDPGVNMVLG